MAQLLILVLWLYQLNSITFSEPLYSADLNAENDNYLDTSDPETDFNSFPIYGTDIIPMISSNEEETQIKYDYPLSALSIDYNKNSIVLHFKKSKIIIRHKNKYDQEKEEKRRSLDQNFMRFGRSRDGSGDFMRFGKRQAEFYRQPKFSDQSMTNLLARLQVQSHGPGLTREIRSDNGRNGQNFMRLGRAAADFMRFGRKPNENGANVNFKHFLRLRPNSNWVPLSRTIADPIKLYSRARRASSFMRFGRGPPLSDTSNFMRFGKSGQSFMRFGRRENVTKRLMKSKTKINETPPSDKAIEDNFQEDTSFRADPVDSSDISESELLRNDVIMIPDYTSMTTE